MQVKNSYATGGGPLGANNYTNLKCILFKSFKSPRPRMDLTWRDSNPGQHAERYEEFGSRTRIAAHTKCIKMKIIASQLEIAHSVPGK